MSRRKLVGANWKMNGSLEANAEWLKEIAQDPPTCETVVFPPFVFIPQVIAGIVDGIAVGGQNLSQHAPGAYTGEVAGEMLVEIGCRWVIVGHSERRARFGEIDLMVAAKARRALDLGLHPIVCVGETLAERRAGKTLEVIGRQVASVLAHCSEAELGQLAIAYEPRWAIGTGHAATPEQAQEVHKAIRAQLGAADQTAAGQVRLIYGGSVSAENAAELFAQPDIDGGLIGGASLKAREFRAICAAAD
jgi:triosephosphate isomerase (TIM)